MTLNAFKNYFAFLVIFVWTALIIEGYYDIKNDLASTRDIIREEELRLANIKARLAVLERIGVEIAVIDFSDLTDLIYVRSRNAEILDTYFSPGGNEELIPLRTDDLGTRQVQTDD